MDTVLERIARKCEETKQEIDKWPDHDEYLKKEGRAKLPTDGYAVVTSKEGESR